MNKGIRTAALLLLAMVLLIALIATVFTLKRPDGRSIELTADEYTLFFNKTVGERTVVTVTGDTAKNITKTLSGEYKGYEYQKELKNNPKALVRPTYRQKSPKEIDKYADKSYLDKDEKGNTIVYGETIYIISRNKIAIWDDEIKQYWVGIKKGPSIELNLIKNIEEKAVSAYS